MYISLDVRIDETACLSTELSRSPGRGHDTELVECEDMMYTTGESSLLQSDGGKSYVISLTS